MIPLKDMVKHIWLRSFFSRLLDFIFPKKPSVTQLENMPLETFLSLERSTPHPLDWIKPVFSYRNTHMKELVWQIKYKRNGELALKVAEILVEEIQSDLAEILLFESRRKPILIPIPLSERRLRERGYNQTELIGKEIAIRVKHIDYRTDILIRAIHTSPQTHTKTRKERLSHILDCFEVIKPELVRGKIILLLDDVTTTGATLNEARKVLMRAGAKDVRAYTVAH